MHYTPQACITGRRGMVSWNYLVFGNVSQILFMLYFYTFPPLKVVWHIVDSHERTQRGMGVFQLWVIIHKGNVLVLNQFQIICCAHADLSHVKLLVTSGIEVRVFKGNCVSFRKFLLNDEQYLPLSLFTHEV